jgi:hypothetical protein
MSISVIRRRLLSIAVGFAVLVALRLIQSQDPASAAALSPRGAAPQTAWAACNANANGTGPSTFTPMSDAAAAALVTHVPEDRADNATAYSVNGTNYTDANDFVPTQAQIAAAHAAKTNSGQSIVAFDPYIAYVDGLDGLSHPSTDDLIQWAAHKWGIPEDWLRAQYVVESYWNNFQLGDDTSIPAAWYAQYPYQARDPRSSTMAYESMGISQVRWAPDGSLNAGSEPLRWESTAFNIDWQAATVRFYYDNPQGARSRWGDTGYQPCQQWNSVGAWNSPYPWNNAQQQSYIQTVQQNLSARTWTTSSFQNWKPSSLPPGVTLLK